MADDVAALGPQTGVDPAVELRLARAGTVVRWVVALYATVVLAGAVLEEVRAVLPSGPALIPAYALPVALPLALLSWGLVGAGGVHRATTWRGWRRAGKVISVAAISYGVLVGVVRALRLADMWPVAFQTLSLPSWWALLMLIVLGGSILLSLSTIEPRVVSGQVGALVVFSTTAVILLGYAYGDVSVGLLVSPPAIAFEAALVSLLLSVGVILMRPGSGILATASSPAPGGRLLRRFGPVILILPALVLLVVETVPTPDRIDVLAWVSVGLGLFLLVLVGVFVRVIDETKIEARTAAAHAERARTGLEQEAPLVRSLAQALHVVDIGDDSALDVATRFRPGQGSVAGDASEVRVLPDGSVAAVLVDMTGHGAEPTIRALRLRDLLMHSLALGKSPSGALGAIGWSASGGALASAVVALIDPGSGGVSVASAGHPPAMCVGHREVELIGPTGPLLYLEADARYREVLFELSPGDRLVLVSDGIVDVQRLRDGRPESEVLGEALMAEGGAAAQSAELAIGFSESEAEDDQSVIVIRREP